MDNSLQNQLLTLVCQGISHNVVCQQEYIDWESQEYLAEQQGVLAVLLDGIECLPEDKRLPQTLLLQWIGKTVEGFENRYELYCRTIAEMAGWYNRHGYKMMLLKGLACGLDWPNPEHRPYGDIDIWLFGQQKEADEALSKELHIKIDKSHHHHTVFKWYGFTVENHFDFVNVHARKSSKNLESVFKELGQDDSHFIMLNGQKVYVPSPNLHALFLIRHMVSHFAGSNITLRQVLDWGFFVKAHTNEIDWNWLEEILKQYHMKDFFNNINAICVNELGFDLHFFPTIQFNPFLTERILNETLSPEFCEKEPSWFLPRVLFKYRRWKANAWKRELCYAESERSSFWGGVWNHLLKPAGI